MTLDNGTDGQTDRQTDRVRRNMRPPPREEGRIIMITRKMYRRRASIQDGQAFTSAYDATVLKLFFRNNSVIFRRRSKRIAFLESVNFLRVSIFFS